MSSIPGQPAQPGQPAPTARREPRRLSIFAGLLWILIGSLLLVNNLVADIRVWQLFRDYWPVLLILLGLVKLADHFRVQQSGGAPARLVSGGEIFLLIMLFIVGGAIAGWDRVRSQHPDIDVHFPWEEEYVFPETASHAALAARPVRIDLPRGNVTVIADSINEIQATVQKRVRGGTEEEARERAQDSGIEIVEMDNSYVVRRRSGSKDWLRLDVEVRVPSTAAVTARTGSGSVRVQGTQAGVNVDADGNLEVRDVKGNVEAKVDGDVVVIGAAGDVRIDGSCDDIEIANVSGAASVRCGFTGNASFRNIARQLYFKSVRTEFTAGSLPGRMEIGSGDLEVIDAPKDVTLLTQNYRIRMENVAGRIQVENRNASVEIRMAQPPTDDISITNRRGGVELVLPANAAFDVDARSDRGKVDTNFAGLNVRNEGRDQSIEGVVGKGGPRIRIRSTYDDVSLRKGP
ncbi:MAG: DUF4097 family beta strand repeat-containing protein [Candidatus Acidiferrales bacterium]